MRRTLLALVLAGTAMTTSAIASDVTVTLDEVRTITFGKPVATVYVGNPSIADINMIDARHAFVQGKGYGSTNIVALNQDGVQVSNTRISVQANMDRESTVTLNRGANRLTYSCTAYRCEATPQPGDAGAVAQAAAGAMTAHQQAAKAAATSE